MQRGTVGLLGMLLGSALICTHPVHAAVFISEVYSTPKSTENEWVELCNTGQDDITIINWQVFDQISTPSLLLTLENAILPAASATVFQLPSAKLNNTGDGVTLLGDSGEVLDQVSFGNGTSGESFARFSLNEVLTLGTPSPGDCLTQPTPTAVPPSSTPTPMVTPTPKTSPTPLATPTPIPPPTGAVVITEVYGCPLSDQTEWVELQNTTNANVSLAGLILLDEAENQIVLSGEISPQAFHVVSIAPPIINNSGDSLLLSTTADTVYQRVALPACTQGKSSIVHHGSIYTAYPPTPGEPNPTPSLPTPTATITTNAQFTTTSKSGELLGFTTTSDQITTVADRNSSTGSVLGQSDETALLASLLPPQLPELFLQQRDDSFSQTTQTPHTTTSLVWWAVAVLYSGSGLSMVSSNILLRYAIT